MEELLDCMACILTLPWAEEGDFILVSKKSNGYLVKYKSNDTKTIVFGTLGDVYTVDSFLGDLVALLDELESGYYEAIIELTRTFPKIYVGRFKPTKIMIKAGE